MARRFPLPLRVMLGCLGMAWLIAACGTADQTAQVTLSTPPAPVATAGPAATQTTLTPQVVVDNFSFKPQVITVTVGTTVVWQNQDDTPHTVTATDKRFTSSALDTGDVFTHQFLAAGTYTYYCMIHPKMTGTIVVQEEGAK